MRKSRRLVVFSELEKTAFYEAPNFDDSDREEYFNFSEDEIKLIGKSKKIHLNIYTAIQLAYFKVTKMFFYLPLSDVNKEDLKFLITRYFPEAPEPLVISIKYIYYAGKKAILKHYGYNDWSKKFYQIAIDQVGRIIRLDTTCNFIGRELIKFFQSIKVVKPGYSILQNIVSEGLAIERSRINTILNKELKPDEKKLIISLILVKDGISTLAELHQDAKNFGFKMMSEERRKHRILEELYEVAQKATSKLEISQQNIKYYGNLAIYYNARDLSKLKYNQAYLYVLCYIYIKYQAVNDNLVEAFRYNIKKIDDRIRAKVEKRLQVEKEEVERQIGKLLLLYVNKKINDEIVYKKVRKRAYRIMEKDKIEKVGNRFLKKGHHKKESFWKEVDKSQNTYQKNLRPLFKSLKFASEEEGNKWLESTQWLKNKFDTKDVKSEKEPDNLPKHLKKYFFNKDKSFNSGRYEYWVYKQMQEQIKSGVLYVKDSILHNCFNHELISVEKSQHVLKDMDVPWIKEPIIKQVNSLIGYLDDLWIKINEKYEKGELKHLRYDEQKKKFIWSKIKAQNSEELENKFYSQLPFCEINQVMNFVNEKTNFLSALKPIQDRYHKEETISNARVIAAILSKALNHGDYKMSQASDISYQELKTTTSQTLRLDTLKKANDIICDAITKLPIYPYFSIDLELLFSSVDGQKYELETPNIKARNSKKYLREKPGVSAYTILANNIPFNSYVIGSNEHESHYIFDIWYNNTTNIEPQAITGDMHSLNKCNFALLHCFGVQYKPRFTSLNTELKQICCSKNIENYANYQLVPIKQIDSEIIIKNEDKIIQILGTLAVKEMNQANLVKKLCNLPPENSLRKAIFELDKLIRSIYTLEYMIDPELQRNVHRSQNKIEEYHKLRAAIAKVGGRKQLYGRTDPDIEVANQCGRLVANLAICYNSLILSGLIEQNPELLKNRKFLNKLKKISPIAWQHIHFLGQYTFKTTEEPIDMNEILKNINWKF